MPRERVSNAANDNAPPPRRKVTNGLLQDLPITEYELTLIETHIGHVITNMLNAVANDNASAPDRRRGP